MNLRNNRNENARAIAEGKFIETVLKRSGKEIDQETDKRMQSFGFDSAFWNEKSFLVTGGNTLENRRKKQHRFVDMKTRNTVNGKIRKRSYPIHNKVFFGHLNNIVRELSFGFTEKVIADMKNMEIE